MRPVRPSSTISAEAEAKKFAGQPATLAVRVDKATLKALRKSAALAGMTIKRFVLSALAERGVEVAEQDLANDE